MPTYAQRVLALDAHALEMQRHLFLNVLRRTWLGAHAGGHVCFQVFREHTGVAICIHEAALIGYAPVGRTQLESERKKMRKRGDITWIAIEIQRD